MSYSKYVCNVVLHKSYQLQCIYKVNALQRFVKSIPNKQKTNRVENHLIYCCFYIVIRNQVDDLTRFQLFYKKYGSTFFWISKNNRVLAYFNFWCLNGSIIAFSRVVPSELKSRCSLGEIGKHNRLKICTLF